jgi:hypothetical protein
MTKVEIRKLADQALDAFWDHVAARLPAAKTGDLSPDRTIRLQIAAEEAISEWIANNVAPETLDSAT